MLIRVEFQFAIGNRQNDAQESYEILDSAGQNGDAYKKLAF